MKSIKALRVSRKLTQREVAKMVGITESSYQRYEYGKRIPRVQMAVRIARALSTTVEDIWGGNPKA